MDTPIQVLSIWGDNKTGKSTLALTAPKPMLHMDLDLGFQRAAPRFQAEIASEEITTKRYPVPLQTRPPRIYGIKEVWQTFQADLLKALESKTIKTVVVDTHTQLWEICRLGFLQEKQENQFYPDGNMKKIEVNGKYIEQTLRERLLPIEYGEPNNRMRSIIYAARSMGKILVLTHYARDIYRQVMTADKGLVEQNLSATTGEREADAWKYVEGLCDIMVKTSVSVAVPQAKVTLSGVGLSLVGVELTEPTYDKLVKLVNFATV